MATPSSYEAIGRALGVPPSTIRYWASRGAPIKKGAPNDLDAIRAWLVSFRATNPPKGLGRAEASPHGRQLAEAKLALEVQERRLQNELLALKVAKARSASIPIADAEAEQRALARAVKRRLLELPAGLAPTLVGRDRRTIETLLRSALDAVLQSAAAELFESAGPEPTS